MTAPSEKAHDEAAEWVARMDSGCWTADLEAELEQWLAGDEKNPGALLHAQAVWHRLDDATAERVPSSNDNGARPHKWWLGGAAAALLAVVGTLSILPDRGQEYRTQIGEIRRVPLGDGSIATINTASDVDVNLAKDQRDIVLERGEAWFQVAHDRKRPFVVAAGRVRVVAVGTAFAVRREKGGAEVLVTEGVVEAWASGAEGRKVRLAAGHQAFIGDNAAVRRQTAPPSSIDRALAWRGGKIELVGDTLGDAAEEFNRYNERKIVIRDKRLADERFNGLFSVDDPEGFVRAVGQSLNVRVRGDRDQLEIG
jgi:transmembrane sensor